MLAILALVKTNNTSEVVVGYEAINRSRLASQRYFQIEYSRLTFSWEGERVNKLVFYIILDRFYKL